MSSAADWEAAVAAIRAARAAARQRAWAHRCPVPGTGPVIVDLDATIVEAHSLKEGASPTFKRTFGFHPVLAFVDHGAAGTGEPLAALPREGRANANNAGDQIALVDAALAQLPEPVRGRVLVRGDAAAGVQALLHHLSNLGLQYSVGVNAGQPVADALAALSRRCWQSAIDADGQPRDGAQVAELTRHLPASHTGWPAGMRVIARRERPHPGAQLRLTDHDGWRITVFATNTAGGRIAKASCGTGTAPAPKTASAGSTTADCATSRCTSRHEHHPARTRRLATELLTWTQTLAFTGSAAKCREPKRIRLRLPHVAGRIVTTGRRHWLRLPRGWPWAELIINGHTRLLALT